MYAVIESGGKQYRVEPGDVIDIERVEATGKKVRKVKFDRVLLVGDENGAQVGTPGVKGAAVSAVLVDDVRGPKVRVFKMKRRKGYRKSQGHRQDLMRVRIDDIKTTGNSKGGAPSQAEPTETESES